MTTVPVRSTPTPGPVIILNGASSSGKTTLAGELQGLLPGPFLRVSSDLFADGMLPARWDGDGPLDWWAASRGTFYSGFHHCLPALARSGNNLIVDHLIEQPGWRIELARLLENLDVFLVGVHCDLDELDRRERARPDRRPGEGRTHVVSDRVHSFGAYDHEVDTSAQAPHALAIEVVDAWHRRTPPGRLLRCGEEPT
jgi:chloramphenicol 3-O phosphotransferase